MEKVYEIVQDAALRAQKSITTAPKSQFRGFSASNLRQRGWMQYQSVAHLWAALVYMREQPPTSPALPDVLDQFLRAAEWFRTEGETYNPFKAPLILNPGETWKLPAEIILRGKLRDLDLDKLTQCDVAQVIDRSHVRAAMLAGHMILPTGLGVPAKRDPAFFANCILTLTRSVR